MKKRPGLDYEKIKTVNELLKPSPSPATAKNLYDCVREIFPDTRPRKLSEWLQKKNKKPFEPEFMLFFALICGAYFRTLSPEVQLKKLRENLKYWLCEHEDTHRMHPDDAGIIIEALTPGMRRAIEARGHQRGLPEGDHVCKKGRIPFVRGAWIAGLVIQDFLMRVGMKSVEAKSEITELISILLEKKEGDALREYNRFYKSASKETIPQLTVALIKEYTFLVKQDGVHAYPQDLAPRQEQIKEHVEWKLKHKSLSHYLKSSSCDGLCSGVIDRIGIELWKSLW